MHIIIIMILFQFITIRVFAVAAISEINTKKSCKYSQFDISLITHVLNMVEVYGHEWCMWATLLHEKLFSRFNH